MGGVKWILSVCVCVCVEGTEWKGDRINKVLQYNLLHLQQSVS